MRVAARARVGGGQQWSRSARVQFHKDPLILAHKIRLSKLILSSLSARRGSTKNRCPKILLGRVQNGIFKNNAEHVTFAETIFFHGVYIVSQNADLYAPATQIKKYGGCAGAFAVKVATSP